MALTEKWEENLKVFGIKIRTIFGPKVTTGKEKIIRHNKEIEQQIDKES